MHYIIVFQIWMILVKIILVTCPDKTKILTNEMYVVYFTFQEISFNILYGKKY